MFHDNSQINKKLIIGQKEKKKSQAILQQKTELGLVDIWNVTLWKLKPYKQKRPESSNGVFLTNLAQCERAAKLKADERRER